ncbi:MarC family protein [Kitasatospora sp. MAP5-34]|uniref:MarC family protein n=1 Tax=Kitasatospora sp. MAP5-34 TaxID=3035102 RepID=UPI0024748AAF|nr:MarC family protein [Kitasatospora sp. MAP5-34]MDH6574932.1 multiple antibiotic resistance protein [Kitasatospora sp. MAP5-34]
MSAFNLSSAFVTFFAVVGPPKVLLAFAHVAKTRGHAELRKLTLVTTVVAAVVGVTMAYTADWLTTFFHISDESLQLAGGVIFFIYAVALVLGIHLGGSSAEGEDGTLANPLAEGVRELMLPYVASPLAITAVLVESLEKDSWSWHSTVAGAYLAVVVINCLAVLLLSRLLRRTHQTSLEVLSRLLGLLLAAVGVELFLNGLQGLGVHVGSAGH